MKLTKTQLKKIIKEETEKTINELGGLALQAAAASKIGKKVATAAGGKKTSRPFELGTGPNPSNLEKELEMLVAKSRNIAKKIADLNKEAQGGLLSKWGVSEELQHFRGYHKRIMEKIEEIKERIAQEKTEADQMSGGWTPEAPQQTMEDPKALQTPEPKRHLGMSSRYLKKRGWKWDPSKGDFFKGAKDLTSHLKKWNKGKERRAAAKEAERKRVSRPDATVDPTKAPFKLKDTGRAAPMQERKSK